MPKHEASYLEITTLTKYDIASLDGKLHLLRHVKQTMYYTML